MRSGTAFEEKVLRVARNLWSRAMFSGAEIVDGRERDGIFRTEDVVHLLECTELRTKDKAEKDSQKLSSLGDKLAKEFPEHLIKCWFVTKDEPTPDQRSIVKQTKRPVTILSFHQFQSKLVQSLDYLELRRNSRFGSIADPKTGGSGEALKYVEIDMIELRTGKAWELDDITQDVLNGGRFSFIGDFGVGKSMTLREVFRRLSARHFKKETATFPIYLNLREHLGQPHPVEMIERHARLIGYADPAQLVRAWKAGYCTLLLDGFDEISSVGLQGGWRRLKEIREASMASVKALIQDTPEGAGVILTGRGNFFDNEIERRKSTGTKNFIEINLSEFNETQIEKFLQLNGYRGKVPAWMPSRALLLGVLFAQGLKAVAGETSELDILETCDASTGWNILVQEICDREANIEPGLNGSTIRRILENLATRARSTNSGLGPISPSEMSEAFEECCGYPPADQALTVLQRLSGFGLDPGREDGARNFLDADFADACAAGKVAEFLCSPYNTQWPKSHSEIRHTLGSIGVSVAVTIARQENVTNTKSAFKFIEQHQLSNVTKFDILNVGLGLGLGVAEKVYIDGVELDDFEVADGMEGLGLVHFSNCLFDRLRLDPSIDASRCPEFVSCVIDVLDGRVSKKDLPTMRFSDCEISVYTDDIQTNSSVFKLEAPHGVRVLLSILKKLFIQSLSGRDESAFYRGIDQSLQKVVPEVLDVLRKSNFAVKSDKGTDKVWLPIRRKKSEVIEILTAPLTSQHPLVKACRELI